MKIIGISAEHDSSTCILNNGDVEYFVKEERLSGIKRDRFPILGISNAPKDKKEISLAYSSPSFNQFHFENYIDRIVKKYHNVNFSADYSNEHHLIHANLAFYDSGFSESLVFVIDRMGSEVFGSAREAESVYVASYPNSFVPIYKNFWMMNTMAPRFIKTVADQNLDCDYECRSMYGIVKTYESATSLINQHALENGKIMGLSAYGDKTINFHDLFINKTIPNDYYFSHDNIAGFEDAVISKDLHKISTHNLTYDNHKAYADYAWQVQKQTQEAVAALISKYTQKTGIKNVCITGGYGLNVVANHYYITQFPEINFFFEPLADDSGNSLGAAMKMYRDITLDKTIKPLKHTFVNGKKHDLNNRLGKDVEIKDIALLISNGKSVAVYNGLAESGPRSLGNRSILFDPRDIDAKNKVNKIKKREWYRPFAGMVLEKDADKYFNMGKIKQSEFMTISFPVREYAKNIIPGIIHVDDTCRIQTVNETNIIIYNLLEEFKKITGIGVILNTSFNLAGKPLVETPENAFETLKNSELDYIWFPEISKIVSKDDLQ
jgi:carbamoyltransferase